MRSVGIVLVAGLACAVAHPAMAGVKTSVKTETYAVTGDTGEALLRAMDRNGPRHGLLARAMAQTRYKVDWKFEWLTSAGGCRLKAAHGALSITYRYPALAKRVSPALDRRWKTFMSGVRKHEEMHGRIAGQMMAATHKSISGTTTANDRRCVKAQRKVERAIDRVYGDYEARQARFDEKEHRNGGAVDSLLAKLTR